MKFPNICLAALSLLAACQRDLSTQDSSASALPATRVAVPLDPGTLQPWTLNDHSSIRYMLNLPISFQASAQEAFRQWAAALQGDNIHVRFSQTYSLDSAHIVVSGFTSKPTAGCVNSLQERWCDINLTCSP